MNNTIQITKTSEMEELLNFIRSKYQLFSDEDIIKMAVSNQYNLLQSKSTQTIDETDYLNSSPANRAKLEAAISQDFSKARRFKDTDELKKAIKF